jgi:hypothetical protein
MIPVFRPPYGHHDAASDAAAAAAGFPTIVLWDVTGGDADRRTGAATVLANASAGRPGSIVLLHAGPSVTPRILPALIARYRARGFTFVTVPELLGIASTGTGLSPGDGSPTPPDPGGPPAPTPPAVPPAGDDHGSLPISPDDAPAPSTDPAATPSTGGSVAGQDDAATPAATDPAATPSTGGSVAGQDDAATPAASPAASPAGWDFAPPPREAAGSSGSAATSPLARDAAWTRGPSRDGLVAGTTVALLGILLLLGAIAGRRERRRA